MCVWFMNQNCLFNKILLHRMLFNTELKKYDNALMLFSNFHYDRNNNLVKERNMK